MIDCVVLGKYVAVDCVVLGKYVAVDCWPVSTATVEAAKRYVVRFVRNRLFFLSSRLIDPTFLYKKMRIPGQDFILPCVIFSDLFIIC